MWRGALQLPSSARALTPKALLLRGETASLSFDVVFENRFNDKLAKALSVKTFRAGSEITSAS